MTAPVTRYTKEEREEAANHLEDLAQWPLLAKMPEDVEGLLNAAAMLRQAAADDSRYLLHLYALRACLEHFKDAAGKLPSEIGDRLLASYIDVPDPEGGNPEPLNNTPTVMPDVRPNGGGRSELRMDAYYYSFTPTGVEAIDRILSAVARAGKAYHHTEDWNVTDGTKGAPVQWIQQAANEAAAEGQGNEADRLRTAIRRAIALMNNGLNVSAALQMLRESLAATPTEPTPCRLGCATGCKAELHGCASECVSMPWRAHLKAKPPEPTPPPANWEARWKALALEAANARLSLDRERAEWGVDTLRAMARIDGADVPKGGA